MINVVKRCKWLVKSISLSVEPLPLVLFCKNDDGKVDIWLFPGEVIVFFNHVYYLVTFSLTFASNTPQCLMGERMSAHVQNQNKPGF